MTDELKEKLEALSGLVTGDEIDDQVHAFL